MHQRHSPSKVAEVLSLCAEGLSDYPVARVAGVPRSTVQNWRAAGPPTRGSAATPPSPADPADDRAYAYLLGLYLGDGHLCVQTSMSADLRLYMDASYPNLISMGAEAIRRTVPATSVRTFQRSRDQLVVVRASAPQWPALLPQHGPGKKHERRIALAPWQARITRSHPLEFLRGLIHSDGSRCMNRFSVSLPSGHTGRYEYPRYFFTNLSADIRGIFCDHCELIGVRWSQPNARNISVSHRKSVAILDSFVEPKS